jgi:hypothetical protein
MEAVAPVLVLQTLPAWPLAFDLSRSFLWIDDLMSKDFLSWVLMIGAVWLYGVVALVPLIREDVRRFVRFAKSPASADTLGGIVAFPTTVLFLLVCAAWSWRPVPVACANLFWCAYALSGAALLVVSRRRERA